MWIHSQGVLDKRVSCLLSFWKHESKYDQGITNKHISPFQKKIAREHSAEVNNRETVENKLYDYNRSCAAWYFFSFFFHLKLVIADSITSFNEWKIAYVWRLPVYFIIDATCDFHLWILPISSNNLEKSTSKRLRSEMATYISCGSRLFVMINTRMALECDAYWVFMEFSPIWSCRSRQRHNFKWVILKPFAFKDRVGQITSSVQPSGNILKLLGLQFFCKFTHNFTFMWSSLEYYNSTIACSNSSRTITSQQEDNTRNNSASMPFILLFRPLGSKFLYSVWSPDVHQIRNTRQSWYFLLSKIIQQTLSLSQCWVNAGPPSSTSAQH